MEINSLIVNTKFSATHNFLGADKNLKKHHNVIMKNVTRTVLAISKHDSES